MKRVGILTFHFADNYGAVMQAYGLVTCLRDLGLDASIVNYHPDHVTNGGKLRIPSSKKNIRANIVIIYQKTMKAINCLRDDHGLKKDFQSFRDDYLHVSEVKYKSLNDLENSPPVLDVYITGSDQVWNPSEQYGVDPAYFLDFGDGSTKRVSYAASFGRDVLPVECEAELNLLLNKLDAITLREKTGVEIAKRISSVDAQWMPDPTLLLEDYQEIVSAPDVQNPYMFSYVLRSGKGITGIQKYIANKLGLKILAPHNPMKRWKDIGETIYPSPEQWLGYIKHSEYVVTNSFHGTVFSVLFNKPFITIGLMGKKGGLNERAKSLLERLGLEDRLLTDLNNDKVDFLMKQEIDWLKVNSTIAEWRAEALAFIKKEIVD